MKRDLIDSRELMDMLRNYMDFECPVKAIDSVDELIRMVVKLKKVDAEPVRHGRWENGMRCSFCKQIDTTKPNYCPNCGAKMDAEVQDDK